VKTPRGDGDRVNPFSLSALRFHIPLVVGVAGCTWAGWFELGRARDGHTIAWLYTFEWPGFAITGIFMWWWLITNRDLRRPDDTSEPDIATDDPGLAAWQSYLADIRGREQSQRVDETG
jgi:hypothetical protein